MAAAPETAVNAPAQVEAESVVRGRGLPLFYQKPAAVEKSRHAKAGLVINGLLGFARGTNSIPLNAFEFLEAAKFYPIVFSAGENPAALAVVGLEQENYFVGTDDRWLEDFYIPAYVRQYPFLFFEQPADQKLFLCIDEKAPNFRAEGGTGVARLFTPEGEQSPLIAQALEFCSSYYRHHGLTQQLIRALSEHKLLTPYESQATLKNGRKVGIGGFFIIDEAALNALPEKVFLEFRANGWLPLIYLALTSASNWKRLVTMADRATQKKMI